MTEGRLAESMSKAEYSTPSSHDGSYQIQTEKRPDFFMTLFVGKSAVVSNAIQLETAIGAASCATLVDHGTKHLEVYRDLTVSVLQGCLCCQQRSNLRLQASKYGWRSSWAKSESLLEFADFKNVFRDHRYFAKP